MERERGRKQRQRTEREREGDPEVMMACTAVKYKTFSIKIGTHF